MSFSSFLFEPWQQNIKRNGKLENLKEIIEPTLLLDKKKCLHNIKTMVEKAQKNNVIFRPHFKTHQSHEIGRRFRDMGVDRITVSSLKMAEYFAADGWNDITVAFPVNLRELERINQLAQKITLNLLVESPRVVAQLAERIVAPMNLYIKIDSGYHRTGVAPENFDLIDSILQQIDKTSGLSFCGFLSHAGHSYGVQGREAIEKIHQQSVNIFSRLRPKYIETYPDLIISIGDTPTCSVVDDLSAFDEIRPGNFVFYDAIQAHIGSCSLEQIAVAVACPVVAKHANRWQLILYGGAVHFSKDLYVDETGRKVFGLMVYLADNGWTISEQPPILRSVSQEHGVLEVDEKTFESIGEGDLVGILPAHSCLTGNLLKKYVTLEGAVVGRL